MYLNLMSFLIFALSDRIALLQETLEEKSAENPKSGWQGIRPTPPYKNRTVSTEF